MFIKNARACKYFKKSLEVELSLLSTLVVLPYKDAPISLSHLLPPN